MILSHAEIRKAVEDGKIQFDPPLEDRQWGEASVDLRLGYQFTRLKDASGITVSVAEGLGGLADSGLWVTRELETDDDFGRPESFEIRTGQFVLAKTHESVKIPRDLIARVEGRSTYARVGLSMHQTAPWIQPGWSGPIVLEIMNSGPLTLKLVPTEDRPCQLTFFRLTSEVPEAWAYGAKSADTYQNQEHALKLKGGTTQ